MVLLGEAMVGKTCIIERYINNHHFKKDGYQGTIMGVYYNKKINLEKDVNLNIDI